MYVQCDVSNAQDVEKMVEKCVERWGRVDMYVWHCSPLPADSLFCNGELLGEMN